MQDLIRPDASFTPRELFARMQGAWFEPRIGSMWQENTGATPTTSGGQTVGLLLGLDQQQQLSSELTTNGTFDADVNGWTGINGTLVWDTGRAKITASNTAPICISSGITTVVGAWYVLTATLARGTGTAITGYVAATNNSNGSGAYAEGSATPVIAGTARLVFRATATTTYVYARYDGASVGQTYFFDDFSLKQIFGNHASQATAANCPTLQFNGNLPLIRHDSTDFLTATLPAINVRRNFLTYPEQFDNAAWSKQSCTVTPNAAVDPNGNLTADLLTGTGGGGYYDKILYRSYTMALAGVTVTFSVYVYAGSATKASLFINKASGFERAVTVADLQPGWNRLSVSKTFVSDSSNGQLFVHICSGSVIDATGVGTIYPWGAQLELGSVATDYQKITDWTSEQYSSAGSVYFSTPSGMSCLHNQSIGTSYNLPALQTDIYGTVITPERLAPPLEQRLALYMHRLAGLSDADFFWQEQATDGMTGQLLTDDGTILLRG